MNVLFHCPRLHQGVMVVSQAEWDAGTTERKCPKCGTALEQKWMQFEDLNAALQGERRKIISRKGPLTYCERQRLRCIHAALRHRPAASLSPAQEDLVLDIAGSVIFAAPLLVEEEREALRQPWDEISSLRA